MRADIIPLEILDIIVSEFQPQNIYPRMQRQAMKDVCLELQCFHHWGKYTCSKWTCWDACVAGHCSSCGRAFAGTPSSHAHEALASGEILCYLDDEGLIYSWVEDTPYAFCANCHSALQGVRLYQGATAEEVAWYFSSSWELGLEEDISPRWARL